MKKLNQSNIFFPNVKKNYDFCSVSIFTINKARYKDFSIRILKDDFALKIPLSFGGNVVRVVVCIY
jgi:hypothetical protein